MTTPEQKLHERARLTLPPGWLYDRIECGITGFPDVHFRSPILDAMIEVKVFGNTLSDDQINWMIRYTHLGGAGFVLTMYPILPNAHSDPKLAKQEFILIPLLEDLLWRNKAGRSWINSLLTPRGSADHIFKNDGTYFLWDDWISKQKHKANAIARELKAERDTEKRKDDLEEMIAWLALQDKHSQG